MEIQMILKRLRIDAGITQAQLSKELSIGQATISQWESGASKPTADALIALSKYYGVSADFILGISHDREGEGKLDEDVEECMALIDNLTNYQRRLIKELLKQIKAFD
ncbi:MAG: helix-turn-helix domain-containing protein [Clostridia bacterium]|nr:helix-turn-helix domain-containing protein [Clostridia bacterium]